MPVARQRTRRDSRAGATAVHAWPETSKFAECYPEMEVISLGPALQNVHSPAEQLDIPSVVTTWALLVAALARMPSNGVVRHAPADCGWRTQGFQIAAMHGDVTDRGYKQDRISPGEEKEVSMDASRFDGLTRRLGACTSRRTALGTALAGVALGGLDRLAAAQDATPPPGATPQTGEKPVFMFVQTFAAGRGEVNPAAGTPVTDGAPTPGSGASFLLTLDGHSGQTIYFSDRPDRIVGAVPTGPFLEELGFTPINPPNAALVADFRAGQGVVVMELMTPAYDPQTGSIVYGAEELGTYEGDALQPITREQVVERLPAEFGSAALFIDDCPDLKACWKVSIFGVATKNLGPIPGGPYGQCWGGLLDGCAPCWTTDEHLKGLCNAAYAECDGRCDVSA
jgi:hypothetical protein